MQTISIFNQKGGVGKTTTAANVGAGLARLGQRVLLIDLDPQANLTITLGIDPGSLEYSVYDLLEGTTTAAQAIVEKSGLAIIPATPKLALAEQRFAGVPVREMLLKYALESVTEFDIVLIDCPPSLGFLSLSALAASNGIYIPIQAEYLPLQGLRQLMDTIDLVKRSRLNQTLEIAGVIATFYDPRKVLHREVMEQIKNHFGDKVFNTVIRQNIALAEAPATGKTIFEYQPNSHGGEDYLALSREILKGVNNGR